MTAIFFASLPLPDDLSAQSAFMTEYQPTQVQMTTVESARYTSLQDTAVISHSVKIVSTADIRTSQPNDTIVFQLPGRTDTLWAEASLITDDSLEGFTWTGKILNKLGYMALFYQNGTIAGFIQVESDFYEIMPLNTTYQFLVERNNTQLKGCGNSPSSPPPAPYPIDPDCLLSNIQEYNTCPATVSVLLVITKDAKNWILNNGYGSIDAYVQIAQATVNLAFYNSDIPNKEIRIKWIERLDIDSTVLADPPNISSDASNIKTLISTDRDTIKADVAILLTYQEYSNASGATLAIGPDTDQAYAIVEVHYAISQYTLAHELGHVFGARHNWPIDAGDDDEEVCYHAKRWIQTPPNVIYDDFSEVYDVEKSWSTVVGIPVSTAGTFANLITDENGAYFAFFLTDGRILHYSNPDVYYGLAPTGRAEGYIANNALLLRNTACTVADFFPTRELRVFVLHDLNTPCLTNTTFSAIITPPESGIAGQPPYTVSWYWNTNGHFSSNNPGEHLGQGVNISIPEYPACPVFWLKCVVTSSDGVTVSRIRRVYIGPATCCEETSEGKPLSTTDNSATNNLFPNPVNEGTINLMLENSEGAKGSFKILDIYGRTLKDGEIEINTDGSSRIDVSKLESGSYLLHLHLISGESVNYKFIIAQN